MIKAVFMVAHNCAEYSISELFKKRGFWLECILPFITKYDNQSVSKKELCAVVGNYFEFGWTVGFENPEQKQMNQTGYDRRFQDRQSRIEIARDVINSLWKGKAVGWSGPVKNLIAQFIREKKVDPYTGEVLKWRVIRDAKKGTEENPSMNMLTPKWKGHVKLYYLKDLLMFAYIMYQYYGPGCMMAKTDMDSAFRQFWLNPSQFPYCIYNCYDKNICDTYMFWGTRTGSKICQDVGQIICRAIALTQNGTHLLRDINEAIEHRNILYFMKKLRAFMTCEDRQKAWEKKLIFQWDKVLIKRWLRSVDLNILIQFVDIYLKDGTHFIACHEDRAKRIMNPVHFDIFKRSQFFQKLIDLKIESRQYLVCIIVNYIDDFLLFLPPSKAFAKELFKDTTDFMSDIGIAEKAEKRDGPDPLLELTGFDVNLVRMKAKYPDVKTFKCKELVFEGIINGFLDLVQMDSMLGKLGDLANMRNPARSFLKRLRVLFGQYLKKYGRKLIMIPLPQWAILDLKWWARYIDVVREIDILEFCDPFMPEDEMSFDGATNGSRENGWNPGMGVWYKGQFIMSQIPQHYKDTFIFQDRDYEKEFAIAHFEMIAIITGLHTFREQFKSGSKLILRTDSMHVLSVMKNKNSNDIFLQSCLRWLCMFAVEKNIRLYLLYINTKKNLIPDMASRFDTLSLYRYATKECQRNNWKLRDCTDNMIIPNINEW